MSDDDGDEFVIAAGVQRDRTLLRDRSGVGRPAEHQGNGPSGQASIAPGGGSVVFAPAATNLVAGDVGDGTEIYRRSLPGVYEDGPRCWCQGATTTPSRTTAGTRWCRATVKVVAFASLDDDLDLSGELSDGAQVYVADLDGDTIDRVSLFTPQGGQVAAAGAHRSRRTAATSPTKAVATPAGTARSPSGVSAICLYDREADTTICVSCVSGAVTSQSFDADIDVDGSVVVFSSAAAGLVAGDTNGIADVFAYDIAATGTHARRSVNDEGAQATVAPTNPHGGSGTPTSKGPTFTPSGAPISTCSPTRAHRPRRFGLGHDVRRR